MGRSMSMSWGFKAQSSGDTTLKDRDVAIPRAVAEYVCLAIGIWHRLQAPFGAKSRDAGHKGERDCVFLMFLDGIASYRKFAYRYASRDRDRLSGASISKDSKKWTLQLPRSLFLVKNSAPICRCEKDRIPNPESLSHFVPFFFTTIITRPDKVDIIWYS
ncbi:hypothetical protein SCHPADRAFT_929933 [Schizopora paradoxa]|uniref:Uncharacterized protein n=1 Tax=Schizopora paradoxa TaxID=27342 RepID=A0A0H2S312_9AGAM|nr:hypothetical protein SCHPADRAFT_929933 [Schizopora paradoxa]